MTCCMFPLSILHVLQSVDRNKEVLHMILNDNDNQQYMAVDSFFDYIWSLLNKHKLF